MRTWLLVLLLLPALVIAAPEFPYDEKADAHLALQTARHKAIESNRKLLVVFGANWCPECSRFDKSIRDGTTPVDPARYELVKIDVGRFDRNLDIAHAFGNPIRKGIPAAVVLSENGEVLYAGSLSRYLDPLRHYSRYLPAVAILLAALGVVGGLIVYLKKR